MKLSLSTPKKRSWLITYGMLLILAQPFFTVAHYAWNETVKPYPWYADSLGIPIFSEIIVWAILAPFAITAVVRWTRKYPGSISLFPKGRARARNVIGVNIIFALLTFYALLQSIDVFGYANVPMLLDVVLSVYLLLAVRAVVISNWRSA